jgi:hypothetical protein
VALQPFEPVADVADAAVPSDLGSLGYVRTSYAGHKFLHFEDLSTPISGTLS